MLRPYLSYGYPFGYFTVDRSIFSREKCVFVPPPPLPSTAGAAHATCHTPLGVPFDITLSGRTLFPQRSMETAKRQQDLGRSWPPIKALTLRVALSARFQLQKTGLPS